LHHPVFIDQIKSAFGKDVDVEFVSSKKHLLTHQIIHLQFFVLKNYIFNFSKQKELNWVSLDVLNELPQPNVIKNFIDENF